MKRSFRWNKSFRQTVSVRNNIITDDESTAILLQMVTAARRLIVMESQYNSFREKMRSLATSQMNFAVTKNEGAQFLFGDLLCGGTDKLTHDDENAIDSEQIVDAYVIELLRLIAMKILLSGVPDIENNQICHSPKDFEHDLIPSIPIREAWKALMIFPVMYSRICAAMGSEPVDYIPEWDDLQLEYNFLGNSNEVIQKKRNDYRWTFSTYERLFVIEPPLLFWPRLEGDDERDTEQNILEDINDYVHRLSFAISNHVGGFQNEILPKDVIIQQHKYSWLHT